MSAVRSRNAGPSSEEIERLRDWRNALAQVPDANRNLNCDTRWEEVRSAGFDPRGRVLQALVRINCAVGFNPKEREGSMEHVRFFVDAGEGLQDLGVCSFEVSDIPDCVVPEHPMYYIVRKSLPEQVIQRMRDRATVASIRVVLSWHAVPVADPTDLPVFGNCVDAVIDLETRTMTSTSLVTPSASAAILNDQNVLAGLHASTPVGTPVEMEQAEAPEHRRAYVAVQRLFLDNSELCTDSSMPNTSEVDLQQVLAVAAAPKGSVEFEELTCIGLCTSTDSVGGTVVLKRRHGYGIGTARCGKEYVALWADCNNDGVFEEYLGTACVEVRDAEPASDRPFLSYAVSIPVPDSIRLLRARGIFKSVRIRGVLSWAVPPSDTNPDALSIWGNRIEAQVRLSSGAMTPEEYRSVDPDFLTWLAQLRPSKKAAGLVELGSGSAMQQGSGSPLDVNSPDSQSPTNRKKRGLISL